jgi:hypothetical protein
MTSSAWHPPTTTTISEIHLGLCPQFVVLSPSRLLGWRDESQHFPQIHDVLCRVCIIQVACGFDKKRRPFQLFARPIDALDFDADRWHWPDKHPLHSYTAKRGHFFLNRDRELERNILPITFFPYWSEVWTRRRPRKEIGFLWSIYHGAVATNVWRACINDNIVSSCNCCTEAPPETLLHRFHHCSKATHAWNYAKTVLYKYVNLPPSSLGTRLDLTWQQCLLGSSLLRRLKPGAKPWSLLQGSIM